MNLFNRSTRRLKNLLTPGSFRVTDRKSQHTLEMNASVAPGVAAISQRIQNLTGGARKTRKVPAVGSKAQVWHGSAKHTSGGLTRKDLMKHKGRIVSRKKHALGKKAFKNLVKAGYKPKKGTFKLFK
jgi:hypothetical protein